jgi:predicted DNA-binding transcriptional regulator YafY
MPPKEDIVTAWDLEQNAWRSFMFDSIVSIETDDFNYVVESA